jgi:hypothetical protein
MDKYSFINGKKKKNIKKPAGNDQWSNAGMTFPCGERERSEAPTGESSVLINPFPENRKYDYGFTF